MIVGNTETFSVVFCLVMWGEQTSQCENLRFVHLASEKPPFFNLLRKDRLYFYVPVPIIIQRFDFKQILVWSEVECNALSWDFTKQNKLITKLNFFQYFHSNVHFAWSFLRIFIVLQEFIWYIILFWDIFQTKVISIFEKKSFSSFCLCYGSKSKINLPWKYFYKKVDKWNMKSITLDYKPTAINFYVKLMAIQSLSK